VCVCVCRRVCLKNKNVVVGMEGCVAGCLSCLTALASCSVFQAAGHIISRGGSPFTEPTYRYSPIYAWLVSWLPESGGGQVLFAVFDLVGGALVQRILCNSACSRASLGHQNIAQAGQAIDAFDCM
jgi:hypothetical protein